MEPDSIVWFELEQNRAWPTVIKRSNLVELVMAGEAYRVDDSFIAPIILEPQCEEVTKMSAVLHDVVEDTEIIIESVELLFGIKVATVVGQLTCTKSENAEDKKTKLLSQISLAGSRANMIKLADVTSNASLIPPAWTLDRTEGYLSWCVKVVETCSDCSKNLYENFIASIR